MLSQLQLNPSAHRHKQTARGSVPIRFGQTQEEPLRTYRAALKNFPDFQTVIKDLPDFKDPDKKIGPPDFEKTYRELKSRARAQFEKICQEIRPQEIEAMKQQKVLGLVEESSDMLFEVYTMKALRSGLINDKEVKQWQGSLPDSEPKPRAAKPFENFLTDINKTLPQDKAKDFEKTVAWDANKSRTLLEIMGAKFTLMRSRDRNYDLMKETKPLLKAEAEELKEFLPTLPALKVSLLANAYTYVPQLPVKFLRSQLESIVSKRLNTKVKYDDLMDNVFQKQLRRQEFDYYNPQYTENVERKRVLKGVEVINEAAILKKARLWNPPAEISAR